MNSKIYQNQIFFFVLNWFLPITDIASSVYEEASRNMADAYNIKNEITNYEIDIKKYKSEIRTKKCKSCNQPTNQTIVAEKKKKLKEAEELKKNLEESYIDPLSIFPSTSVIDPYVKPDINNLKDMEKSLHENELRIYTVQAEIDKINKSFNDSMVAEVRKISEDLEKQKILETENSLNLNDEEKSLAASNQALKKHEREIEKFSTDTKTSSKKSSFAKGIREVYEKSFTTLRDNARGDVGKLAGAVFVNLINKKGYQIQLEENYSVSMLDEDGTYAGSPSDGQSGVIAISLIAALSRYSVTNAPIVMDSPMASLDDDHQLNVWKFIHQLSDQVILFVHTGEYRDSKHRKIIDKNLSIEYTLEQVGVFNAKIVEGYKPKLLKVVK